MVRIKYIRGESKSWILSVKPIIDKDTKMKLMIPF